MQSALKPPAGKMITDFPTAPLAPGLRGAGGGTVEKSFYASHTEILTLPAAPEIAPRYNNISFLQFSGEDLFKTVPFYQSTLIYHDRQHLNELTTRFYGEVAAGVFEE